MRSDDEDALVTLGAFAATTRYEDLPPRAVEAAKRVLQHNLIVALAGRGEAIPGQDLSDWPAGMPAGQCATRYRDGGAAPAERAIVDNALAMGARAQHDEHPGAITHFGSAVIPPLLAAAEIAVADGATVLSAMIVGYEVGARIGESSVRAARERGFRPTGLYGPFAAAAAVGRTLELTSAQLVSALALAANSSSGLMQTWLSGTDEWRYQTAFAGRNGFAAARLAAEGVRGATDTLNGDSGFFPAYTGEKLDTELLTRGLGQVWAIEKVMLKPYPVCAFNQAPVQQAIRLCASGKLSAGDVARARILLNPADLSYPGVTTAISVRTRAEALMCLRTCVAIAVLDADVSVERLEAPDSADIADAWSRVDLVADAEIPSHMATVEIVTADGDTVSSGEPAPVQYDDAVQHEMIERLREHTGLTPDSVAYLVEVLSNLEGRDSIDEIFTVIRSALI